MNATEPIPSIHPDLAAEFTQLHLELRANASREEALRNFAERGRDVELRKFVALLIDTDRFGSSSTHRSNKSFIAVSSARISCLERLSNFSRSSPVMTSCPTVILAQPGS